MPTLETPEELADHLADLLGVYGSHDELCDPRRPCRVCWVPDMAERIRAAVKAEATLAQMTESAMQVTKIPWCHWCETRHLGERLGPDKRYCPGPLLQPYLPELGMTEAMRRFIDPVRTKPLTQVKLRDIPRGLSAEDIAVDRDPRNAR